LRLAGETPALPGKLKLELQLAPLLDSSTGIA
jgi:hypothetical protein